MSFLHILAYVGAVLAFIFVTLSLACGLYYLAELVEEYTVLTKKIIRYSTFVPFLYPFACPPLGRSRHPYLTMDRGPLPLPAYRLLSHVSRRLQSQPQDLSFY
ncbi:transmembrane adaptor Erv26-domain-containing protein [Endogone sp. FLAS-F59071]|nr:transmembrane adaptor Erv26-domain-containing protein [Endogone sp. FLAS-F59071]|eukprot:RUS16610.1 transmembrane adaptor Erv26-domain-containing protein [Endogone sp. FLAS-F59071]